MTTLILDGEKLRYGIQSFNVQPSKLKRLINRFPTLREVRDNNSCSGNLPFYTLCLF